MRFEAAHHVLALRFKLAHLGLDAFERSCKRARGIGRCASLLRGIASPRPQHAEHRAERQR
jgi:hypothetical protein